MSEDPVSNELVNDIIRKISISSKYNKNKGKSSRAFSFFSC